MITHLATQAVYVEDQSAALRFWTDQVGFQVHGKQSMGREAEWIEVGPKGAQSCIVLYPKAMMQGWAQRIPSIVFQCDDVDSTYEAMSSHGVTFRDRPKDLPWGKFAIFEDPEGNCYGLRGVARPFLPVPIAT